MKEECEDYGLRQWTHSAPHPFGYCDPPGTASGHPRGLSLATGQSLPRLSSIHGPYLSMPSLQSRSYPHMHLPLATLKGAYTAER